MRQKLFKGPSNIIKCAPYVDFSLLQIFYSEYKFCFYHKCIKLGHDSDFFVDNTIELL